MKDGKVAGVKAVKWDGTQVVVNAKNVILATGGFAGSEELMEQYNYIKANALNPYPAVAGWFEFQFPHFRKNPLFYLNEKVVVLNGSDYLTYLAAVS